MVGQFQPGDNLRVCELWSDETWASSVRVLGTSLEYLREDYRYIWVKDERGACHKFCFSRWFELAEGPW